MPCAAGEKASWALDLARKTRGSWVPAGCWSGYGGFRFETVVALITGVTGRDGAYLSEHLLGLGYTVHGIKRRSSSFNTARIDHLYQDPHEGNVPFLLHYGI